MFQPTTSVIVTIASLSFLAFFLLCINSYCLIITWKCKKLHKPSNIAICSLIFAHLIQGVVVIPFYVLKLSSVEPSSLICASFRFSYMFTNYASCLSLLVVTFDRFMHLKFPLKYRAYSTVKRMLVVLLCVWVYTLGLCLIPFAYPTDQSCSYNPSNTWTSSMLICNTLVPFLIIFIFYMIIFRKAFLIQKTKRLNRNLKVTYVNKSIRVFLIIFCYVICWGPSCVYYLLESLCYLTCFNNNYLRTAAVNHVTLTMKLMTFIDGLTAPLVYCIGNQSFKMASKTSTKRFQMVFKNIRKKKKKNVREKI